jgi:hypothetical protein
LVFTPRLQSLNYITNLRHRHWLSTLAIGMKSIQVAWADKMDFRIPITIFSRETLNDYKLPTRYHTYREIAPPMDWSSFDT